MRILVLTSVYQNANLGNADLSTNIVNSFVYEWKKNSHDVIVIHNYHRYPVLIHKLPLFIRKKLSSFLNFQIPGYNSVRENIYDDNGVKVYKFPIKKLIPHHSPSKRNIFKQVNKIKKALINENFIPDVIIGHWVSPQIELINLLKREYNCRTAIVLHGMEYIYDKRFNFKKYITTINKLGCRSIYQAKLIHKDFNLKNMPFVCYSGIPDKYLQTFKLNIQKFKNIVKWKIAFVGRLISYKNVDVIIKALSSIKNINWELSIIGEGPEKEKLRSLTIELGCENRVIFYGKISRDCVMDILNEMNVFVMVSNNEVFGLAYLEAMASSCITIASKNGGVDGIILDGKNGFLCNQGDVNDLNKKLLKIFDMDENDIKKLVENSYNTVKKYSDSNVAKLYLKNVMNDD